MLNKFRAAIKAGVALITVLPCLLSASAFADSGGLNWPLYSYDSANTNYNPKENKISPRNVGKLRRAWSTFNDDQYVAEPAPSGFLFEAVFGLFFERAVSGVVSPPVIDDGTIYYIDVLGTVFARDAKTGRITNPNKHWTTTLVDPDYDAAETKLVPDLYYTALALTDTHVWVHSSFYGRLHAIARKGGQEVDFKPATAGIDPYPLVADRNLSSSLGDPAIVKTPKSDGNRVLFITGLDVIVNDALAQEGLVGMLVAIDITNPANPVERWRVQTIDNNPTTGKPYGTGVSAGSGLAVDSKRHLLFGGNGQNTTAPYPNYPDPANAPAGYIDRGDSLWALNYLTGQFVWANQFHTNDVFDLNNPVPAGPNRTDGPRDADVLAPPVLYSAKLKGSQWGNAARDLVANGSKGGLFRSVDVQTGATVWERQISKPTGLGGIQAGAAYANGNLFVAGFEGISDGFSDAQFDAPGSIFKNAFFATFSPAFWADVEDTASDADVATGMRIKVYKLDAATGQSKWQFSGGRDYVSLRAGANMRHVSVANGLVYVTTTSGELIVLSEQNGSELFRDQTLDLNETFNLGLSKPHHAPMNAGALIAGGMVFVPYGGQNNPSGGMIAYQLPRGNNDEDD